MQKIYQCFFDKEDKVGKLKIPNGATILSIAIVEREVIIYTLAEDKVEEYDTIEVRVYNPKKDNIDVDLKDYTFINPQLNYVSSNQIVPYFVWYRIYDTLL